MKSGMRQSLLLFYAFMLKQVKSEQMLLGDNIYHIKQYKESLRWNVAAW